MKSTQIKGALRRGIFHAFAGIVIVIAFIFLPHIVLVIGLSIITSIFLSFELARQRVPSLNRWFISLASPLLRDREIAKLTGSSYFLIGCLATIFLFQRDIAMTAILFMSLGDPAATIVGVWKGRILLGGRSLEGHIACLLICILIGWLLGLTLDQLPLIVAIVGAIFATFFQALPLPFSDNLSIPLGSALAMTICNLFV